MKRILVTGGAGFLGNRLCRRLVEDGAHVTCLDNLITGRREHLADLPEHDFRFIFGNVAEQLQTMHVDEIYHLACPASPVAYTQNPIATTITAVVGTLNVLDLARRAGAKVLVASTSEIYGDPLVHPQTEDYWGNVNPIGPRACYDEGKRCAESLCFDHIRQYGMKISVVRIFNTYGPGAHPFDGRVITNFIMQALLDKPITVYGDGMQTRSFCYLDDMIDGLMQVMASDVSGPINLGNPEEIDMRTLAQLVIRETNSRSCVVYLPLPQDDPARRKPDITKAIAMGWQPRVGIHEGLHKTAEWFRSNVTYE